MANSVPTALHRYHQWPCEFRLGLATFQQPRGEEPASVRAVNTARLRGLLRQIWLPPHTRQVLASANMAGSDVDVVGPTLDDGGLRIPPP